MDHSLKHYVEVMSGIALGKINIDDNAQHSPHKGVQLIRPQDLAQNSILYAAELENLTTILPAEDILKRIKGKHYLQPNDIIITARSTSYHVSLIKSLPENAQIIMNNNLICLRPNPLVEHPESIVVYLNSKWFREQIIDREFPKMLSISVNWLKELPFTLPKTSECELIAQAAFAHRQLKTDLQILSQQSDTLLEAKLFNCFEQK